MIALGIVVIFKLSKFNAIPCYARKVKLQANIYNKWCHKSDVPPDYLHQVTIVTKAIAATYLYNVSKGSFTQNCKYLES